MCCPLTHRRLVTEGKERSKGYVNVSRFTFPPQRAGPGPTPGSTALRHVQGYLHINPSLPQGCKSQISRDFKV